MKKRNPFLPNRKKKLVIAMLLFAFFPNFLSALEKSEYTSVLSFRNSLDYPELFFETDGKLQPKILEIRVQGKVTDQNNVPLPGVTISVEGLSLGSVTDLEGNYSLVVPEGSTLVFSFIGFETQKIVVGVQNIINVTLIEEVSSLDEFVVVGYGTQSKRNVTSSIGSVTSEEIENYPVQQMGQALQGKVAGLHIVQNSGSPGSSLTVRIRGIGTVNNSEPLYVIDGNLGADPSDLDPSHIESIEVLKSASAAAIYGAQGANGVVLITTKNGIKGAPNLQVDFYRGFQEVHRTMPVMNGRQFATIYNQALTNSGRSPLFTDVESIGEGTDWQNAIFRTAPIQNVSFSVNGGTEQGTYFLSGGYFRQKGIVINSDYSRLNFRVNSEYKVNSVVSFGENLSLSYGVRNDIPEFGSRNPVPNSWHMDPTTPVKNPDGSWGFPKFSDTKNPVAEATLYNNTTKRPSISGSAFLDIRPLKNLVFRSQINLNLGFSNGYQYTPTYDIFPLQRNLVTSVSRTEFQWTNWDWQNTVTYDITHGKNEIEILGGITALSNHSEEMSASGQGVPENANSDPNLRYLDLANTGQQVSGSAGEFSMFSVLGRVNYSYNGTYLFTGNFRADGSSKFGSNNRFGIFPSFSAGWRISDEDFMQDISFIDDLKIRGGWGMLGNQNSLPNYAFANSLTSNLIYVFGQDISQGQALTSEGNPDLKWETTKEIDIGFDFVGFENKVTFSASYYKKNTTDMLLRIPFPAFTGVQQPPFVNGGDVLNKGFELMIGYQNTQSDMLFYDVSINLSHNTNEVIELDNNQAAIFSAGNYSRTVVGEPIATFYGYIMDGIFQTQEEVEDHAFQSPGTAPGDIRFRDLNNDGITNQIDRKNMGNPWPDFTYGLNGNLRYKHFDIGVALQGVYGNDIIAAWKSFTQGSNFYNYDLEMLNSWNGEGSSNSIPRVNVNDPNDNLRVSSYFIENGSYLRLKHFQLGYTLPGGTIDKIKKLRVYITGQNLLTFTKYPGFDPEIGSPGSTLDIGVDRGYYPQPRTITVGLNLGF
jgi:TonB-linked SusC/RagA family outer membrane protein